MEYMDPSMLEDENGIIEDADYDNGYEGNLFGMATMPLPLLFGNCFINSNLS